jgi:digeranylgeranylglycerophospholipid reductase
MKSQYDVLVIGGGPGGAMAAKTAAEKGLSTCLIEKRPAIGCPVRCAEGIGEDLLREFIEPSPKWIASKIDGARLIAPDGTSMELNPKIAGNEVGYVLDRKIFDRDLVWSAARAGADVFVKTRAVDAITVNSTVKGAWVESGGVIRDINAKITIAADGVESKFARWCGINTTVPMRELETCAQYLLTDIDIEPNITQFFLGNEIAPAGYVWIFPKGDRTANVGIGIGGNKSGEGHRARDYLDRFVSTHFPNGKVVELIVGGVSICEPLDCTVSDGLIIVGDAARMSDPITGGGIYSALYTGTLAGEVAAECIAKGDCSRESLMKYDAMWRDSKMGKALARNYQFKEAFVKMSDENLNAIVHSARNINLSDFNTKSLFKEIIKNNPQLLKELITLKKLFS